MLRCARLLAIPLLLLLAACGSQRQPGTTPPSGFIPVRDYSWDTPVAQPQGEWAPNDYRVLARTVKGIMVLREGTGGLNVYRTADATEVWEPRWVNDHQFVFGPHPIPVMGENQRILLPNYGLKLGNLEGERLKSINSLTVSGYRPRPWDQTVVASRRNEILQVTPRGEERVIDVGFLPEPQRGGKGLAFQTVPIFHPDFWTGAASPGELVIRWGAGTVDVLPGGCEPVWTPWGGLVCTVLAGPPPAEGPWWKAGTRVMHIPRPGAEPQLVLADARSPEPHPTENVLACVDQDGQVLVVSLDGSASQVITPVGDRPRWSHDGLRLLVEEPSDRQDGTRKLRAYVLRLKEAPAP